MRNAKSKRRRGPSWSGSSILRAVQSTARVNSTITKRKSRTKVSTERLCHDNLKNLVGRACRVDRDMVEVGRILETRMKLRKSDGSLFQVSTSSQALIKKHIYK
ncbi:hypothetical protein L210DRAFT_2493388 [Boletus edulis BED1]|uniref:Uncharacterized protein n=1 Tax=Boletus edulis BED1 TaxID=1328754 RepID=A0AAD4BPU2_BOLED|nr:hypothetical protein L210DRAFT_2493388 [Boletus edulis BED1]